MKRLSLLTKLSSAGSINKFATPTLFLHKPSSFNFYQQCRSFSMTNNNNSSFTETIDSELDRLKGKTLETVTNNRTPSYPIHNVINTLNELGRATSSVLYEEMNSRHPGLINSKRHLKQILTILKRGHKVAAIQPLRGQLTYKRVPFEYKLTKQMKRKLEKPEKEITQTVSTSTEELSEDELFNKTMEAVQKGN
ncbi:predicted protein [Naegleria gruberi]|uniref:Predicted protein n=1 Tax=Naegleria gruberi TaxID=5762 RepID=D2V2K5_NAEGR|nr:uncharacterized protein NAEGRDRAFT_46187 [Naegleria gruberi]EFC49076.1 predicted protein [Naegleria gruberi]|eukprot:XP_002681820.1 predicted protein [Naegleria gruberi strain NEG-M]